MKKPSKYISRKPDSDGYITYPANENKVWQDLSEKQIRECFNFDYYTKNVNNIFKRVFKK